MLGPLTQLTDEQLNAATQDKALLTYCTYTVGEMLGTHNPTISIVRDPIYPAILAIRYPIRNNYSIFDLEETARKLSTFCQWEPDEYFIDNGGSWVIGDGDDSTAVYYNDGAIYIWLRHFQEE